MPLENATYLHQLNPKLPLGTDPVASVDDHIRTIKQALLNTFPNLAGPLTLTANALNGVGVPSKGIIMFSGAVSTVPTGWRLCDGQFGTPDLRDRFIVGAGGQYALGAKGGSTASVSGPAGAHSHTITGGAHAHAGTVGATALTIDQMPKHQHATSWGESNKTYAKYGVNGTASGYQGGGETDMDNFEYMTSEVGKGAPHTHSLELASSGGDHSHTVVSASDHTHSIDSRPPYYALCFIMKE